MRELERIGKALDAETEKLKRQGRAHAAAQRKATAKYLEGLERAGATMARLPAGLGIVSGKHRQTRARRVAPPPRSQASPVTGIVGLADLVQVKPQLPFATLRPPYDLEWTWTKYIEEPSGTGTLEAYAHRANGTCGFEIASKHNASQENRARARAAIGVRFQPTQVGVLGIRPRVDVDEGWYLDWNYAVAHAWGWAGMLVQSYDASTGVLSTAIDRKCDTFDESGGGSVLPPAEIDVVLANGHCWNTSLFVSPSRRYVIWLWCGGGIRAAGWETNILGMHIGSDAESRVDMKVDSIALYFWPLTSLPNLP